MPNIEILDQPADVQADAGWRGFRSRPDPTTLPPGIARYLENMRCDRDFRPRAGTVALATDLVLTVTPAVLDFTLATEYPVFSVVRTAGTVRVSLVSATNPGGWAAADTIAIQGATPSAYDGDWTVTAVGTAGGHFYFEFTITGTPTTPATGTIVAAKGLRLFEVWADRVRAACVYTDDDNTQHALIATGNKAYAYNQAGATAAIDYPSGETVGTDDEADLVPHISYVYLFRGRAAGPELTIASITRVGATVTVTTTPDHNLLTNDWVRLSGQTDEYYRGVYQITKTGAKTFTYDIGAPTPVSPAVTAGICFQVRPVLKWDRNQANDFVYATTGTKPSTAHIRIPPADWGLAFNRQLLLPYARDEVILSGFGVDDDFDTQLGELRIKPGTNDWLVAAHPATRTRFLELYRKSLHVVTRTIDDLSIDGVEEVPAGAGCVARRTVCTCGDFIAWLSDRGVMLAQYVDQLNLLTAKEPLSAYVDDLIQRINWTYAAAAVAYYHDNRYFLAVPLDDSTVNNTLLVFNFINRSADAPFGEWESLDMYPGDFDIAAMLELDYSGRQCLHFLTTLGGLYVAHQGEQDQYGAPGGTLGSYDIAGLVRGRRLRFGTLQPKRFCGVEVSAELVAGAQLQVALSTLNPDSDRTLRDHTATAAEDRVISVHPRSRGESGAVDLTLPAGRPIIRAVTVSARPLGVTSRDRN